MRTVILICFLTGLLSAADGAPPVDARNLYDHGDYSAAIAALRRAPANAENLELLGQCYFMQGEFKKATDSLEKAAALDPKDSMIQTWLGRAWGLRAQTSFPLTAFGYANKTRQSFEKAVKLDPSNPEALGDLFDFYMAAPGVVGGGVDKAAALLPQFEKYDPVGGYLAKARLDEKKKEFVSAEANLRRAVQAEPHKPGVFVELAKFLSRRGRYDESEKVFHQAASVAPGSPQILFARADSYIKARRNMDQARDLLRKYIDADNRTPHDPPVWEARDLLRKAEGT